MSFEEHDRVGAQLHGSGWRHLTEPQMLSCYVASVWMDAPVLDVNDETREARIAHTTVTHGVSRSILDASLYRSTTALFQKGFHDSGIAVSSPERDLPHAVRRRSAARPARTELTEHQPQVVGPSIANSATQPIGTDLATFHCPRCGGDYPRVMLTRYWSDWGRVCTCAITGATNPQCSAFDGKGAVREGPVVTVGRAHADKVDRA
jgi:hypothetical protein